MRAKVAERGQVTIPKELRHKLGIRPGTVLDFYIECGKLIALKLGDNNPVDEVYGCAGRHIDTDKIIRRLRG